jgi:NADPH:quinone reductase-like Zn-dependent oxidoreductase
VRAATYQRYGAPEVVHITEVAKPTPKDNEILVRVRATTVASGDWRARSLNMPKGFGFLGRLVFGLTRPRQPILGTELAGTVEAVGKDVTRFKVGEAVFAFPGSKMGGHAEYKTLPENGPVVLKPANLSFEQAAALSFGGSTALETLKRAKIAAGDRVLVNGASGSVGTALIQIAKHFGAHVTGVTSTGNMELVRSIGADAVVDYTREDFTKNGETYDIIVDTAGTAPFSRSKGSLKAGGRLLVVLGGLGALLGAPLAGVGTTKRVIAGPVAEPPANLRILADLAAAGRFMPVIDKTFPFDKIVEAHRHVDSGRKRGNVVVVLPVDDSVTPAA